MYVCYDCGYETENILEMKCPKCGGRIFFKKRMPVAKEIEAI